MWLVSAPAVPIMAAGAANEGLIEPRVPTDYTYHWPGPGIAPQATRSINPMLLLYPDFNIKESGVGGVTMPPNHVIFRICKGIFAYDNHPVY